MNRAQILATALERMGYRGGSARLAASAETELDIVQQEGEEGVILQNGGTFRPWFLLSEMGLYTLSAGEDQVPVPTAGFLGEYEQGALWRQYNDSDGVAEWAPLGKDSFDRNVAKYGNAPGTPKKYSRDGLFWRVRPIPDVDTELRMLFYKRDNALTAGSPVNKWTDYASGYLLAQLSYRMLEFYAREPEAAQRFAVHATRAIQALYSRHISAEEVNDHTRTGEV